MTLHDFPANVDVIAKRVVWYLRFEGGCHTAGEICGVLRITGRELQHGVQWARMKGHKDWSSIIGDNSGYRWDPSPEAAREAVAQFASRHRAMRQSVWGIVKAAGPGAMQENLGL